MSFMSSLVGGGGGATGGARMLGQDIIGTFNEEEQRLKQATDVMAMLGLTEKNTARTLGDLGAKRLEDPAYYSNKWMTSGALTGVGPGSGTVTLGGPIVNLGG